MCPITIEGVAFTQELIEFLRNCQDSGDFLEANIEVIDDAVSLIACEAAGSSDKSVRTALNIISGLSILKQYLRLLEGANHG